MEATGLSEQEVKSRLNKLLKNGEIVIETTNLCSIVTLCDYDNYNVPEGLFDDNATSQQPAKCPASTQPSAQPIYNKIEEYKNLRSKTSKMERESREGVFREIQALYNKLFDGRLPEWQRLSEKMRAKVELCIAAKGRRSVDAVFDQVLHEPFSMGENKTGFVADFRHIFELEHFEAYLSRYQLRVRKGKVAAAGTGGGTAVDTAGTVVKSEEEREAEQRQRFKGMVELLRRNPHSSCRNVLVEAWKDGVLSRLGIDWEPEEKGGGEP